MKKKLSLSLALLLVAIFGLQAAAFSDDEDEPRKNRRARSNWKNHMLEKTLNINVGMWRAIDAEQTLPDGSVQKQKFDNPDWLFSFGGKLFFYRSNFGVGVDWIMLDSQQVDVATTDSYWDPYLGTDVYYSSSQSYTVQKWMIDVDLYYRLPVSRNLLAIGGIGLTYFKMDWGGMPGVNSTETSKAGYNLKAGGELFIDRDWSITGMFTWHQFDQGQVYAPTTGAAFDSSVKLFSFMAQVNWYL